MCVLMVLQGLDDCYYTNGLVMLVFRTRVIVTKPAVLNTGE